VKERHSRKANFFDFSMDNPQKAEMLQPLAGAALHNFRSNHQNLSPQYSLIAFPSTSAAAARRLYVSLRRRGRGCMLMDGADLTDSLC
jgi:hypothetical protein